MLEFIQIIRQHADKENIPRYADARHLYNCQCQLSFCLLSQRCPWDAGQEQTLITEVRSPDRCMDITEPKYTLIGTYCQKVVSAAQVHREYHNI